MGCDLAYYSVERTYSPEKRKESQRTFAFTKSGESALLFQYAE